VKEIMSVKEVKKQTSSLKGNLVTSLLSLSLFFPFIPFDVPGRHEIFPLFILFLFGFKATLKYLIPINFTLLIFFIFALVFDLESKTIKDFFQVAAVFSSLFLFSKIPFVVLQKVERNIFKLSFLLITFMVFQRLFPEQLQSVTDLMSQRKMLVVDFRSGGVRGFGPEPAYTGSLLISFFMFSWWIHGRLQLNRLLLYGLGVLLTMAISATLTFLALVIFQFLYRLFFVRDLALYDKYHLLVIFILFVSSAVLIDLSVFINGFDRIATFFDMLWSSLVNLDARGFLLAEKAFGSQRLQYLLDPVTKICCGGFLTNSYVPSYSLYGKVWFFFAPLHILLIGYFLIFKKLTAVSLASLTLGLFFGPILLVLLFIGLIHSKTDEKMEFRNV